PAHVDDPHEGPAGRCGPRRVDLDLARDDRRRTHRGLAAEDLVAATAGLLEVDRVLALGLRARLADLVSEHAGELALGTDRSEVLRLLRVRDVEPRDLVVLLVDRLCARIGRPLLAR